MYTTVIINHASSSSAYFPACSTKTPQWYDTISIVCVRFVLKGSTAGSSRADDSETIRVVRRAPDLTDHQGHRGQRLRRRVFAGGLLSAASRVCGRSHASGNVAEHADIPEAQAPPTNTSSLCLPARQYRHQRKATFYLTNGVFSRIVWKCMRILPRHRGPYYTYVKAFTKIGTLNCHSALFLTLNESNFSSKQTSTELRQQLWLLEWDD